MFLIDKMYPIQCLKKLTLDCPPPLGILLQAPMSINI